MEGNLNSQPVKLISQSTVFPSEKSAMKALKLSVSDLPMLSGQYIERGALFILPPNIEDLSSHLKSGLSKALSLFPPFAGRLFTESSSGEVFISCNDAGAHFIVASAPSVSVLDIDVPDVPPVVKEFFALKNEVNFAGHFLPILAVQSTILSDGVFIGCSANHAVVDERDAVVSTFQSLCALLWRCVTRARQLSPERTTTFKMLANYRHRLDPPLHPHYFGNAVQRLRAEAKVGEILSNDLEWCGELLWQTVAAHDNGTVRRNIATWKKNPNYFQPENFDGATISMGSSPRFPAYDGDFGLGKPVAVRSGRGNKYDGKMSAFPCPNGGGTIDVDVVLFPHTMAAFQADPELLHYLDSS